MDPRSHPSRPPSTSLPQGSTPLPTTMSMPMPQYTMQPQYPVSQPHTLPPLQPHHSQSPAPHSYMGQPPYRRICRGFPPLLTMFTRRRPLLSCLTPPWRAASCLERADISAADRAAPPRDRRPDYSGMPSGAFSYSDGKGSPWMNPDPVAGANGASPYGAKEPPRTQVVGSQGRRGILPSVPGRATPVTNGVNGTAKNTTIPAKDADGKFPCPHCNKTYLHAKHLKRHLLRHTGDRPYMCVLCKDTFSRSDILKRHFQKCSLRRGNPTGATHLSHPQAHLKRSQAANPAKPVQDEVSSTVPPATALPGTAYGEGAVNGNGLASGRPGFTDQQPLGFSMSSVNGMNRGQPDDAFPAGQPHQRGPWLAAPKQNPYLAQPGPDVSQQLSVDRPSYEQVKPPVVQDPKRPVMPGPTPNHTGEIDWTSMFQPGANDGYINPVFPQSMASGQEPIHAHVDTERKFYPTTTGGPQEGGMNGLYLASTTLAGDGKSLES
ncbi:putative C2H2 transcription factor (RfeC) [Aspergillus nomiae NRRL 13137]|uniref:Putative C2H2 transcription factor (RfeC) n=1 Tax=Aspergillus nomiae NRRL (strain ATCC 15546 / NRRL 13137 / CBS 260.88 / M93) TaxID=1509407 RepID=A0A0L1IKK9_ASPN3|nr:putative C2H2 transcription factor (RfeC) [Aspergillus nomiae NRRL 13137]KNG80131.1 putative C2H2 transcription factor (RfeC) [Aspergillus nomiae NRRL 13137]